MGSWDVLVFVTMLTVVVSESKSVDGSVSVPSPQPKGRIGQGKAVARTQFGYQARIRLIDEQYGTLVILSGVIVHAYWVMTSAFDLVKVVNRLNNNVW